MKSNIVKRQWEFFYCLNNKKVLEVNDRFKRFIYDNFLNVEDLFLIKIYVSKENSYISVNNIRKTISFLDYNSSFSYIEYIYNLLEYLKEEKVPIKIRQFMLDCFFSFKKKKKKIKVVNNYFRRHNDLVIKLIKRFTIAFKDIIILGSVDDFIYIKKEELVSLLCSYVYKDLTNIHFSKLIFTNLNKNNELTRFFLKIKWDSFIDDIIFYKNKKRLM